MTAATATIEKRCDLDEVKVGSILSTTHYLEVLGKTNNSVKVKDQNGLNFEIRGKELIEDTIFTADQIQEEKKVSRTEAIQILENAKDTVFTVNFNKLPDENSFAELLGKVSIADLNDPKKLKKLAKEAMKGEERTLVGHLVEAEPTMGRSSVIDLQIPKGSHNLRQVDHRTLNWIIFKNIKYVVK
jgi:hypothetical protein